MPKKTTKKVARLLARHLALAEKAKLLFQRSGATLDQALALGVTLNDPIPLRDGRQVMVVDQFAASNRAFKASFFARYHCSEYKEPKRPKQPAPAVDESEVPA